MCASLSKSHTKTAANTESRSERDFAGIAGLLRNHVSPEQVLGVLTSGEWPIGDRLRERDDPDEAARKEVERAMGKLGPMGRSLISRTIYRRKRRAKRWRNLRRSGSPR